MQPGQYIIIKVADIEDKVRELESYEYFFKESKQAEIVNLKSLLTNPTDLYSVVEDAFNAGFNDAMESDVKSDYLNNLEI